MRHYHLKRNTVYCPTINLDKLWTLVSEQTRLNHAQKPDGPAPVIDVVRAKHVKEHHEEVKERPCPHPGCNKVFMIDRYLQRHVKLIHTGRKTREEKQSNRADPLQPSFPHTAPPTTSAAPSSAPLSHSESDGNQHFNSKNLSDSGFSNNTSRYSQEENPGQNQTQTGQNRGPGQNQTQTGQNRGPGQNQTQTGQNRGPGQNQTQTGQNRHTGQNQTQTGQNGGQKQVLNVSTQNEDLGQGQNNTLQNEPQGQTLNNLLQNGHQGQPSIQPSTPEPPPSPVSVASEGAGNILSSVPEEKNRTRVNKTEQETTTSSSSSTSPAPPTNSTTATNTTVTMTTVTTNTIGTNHKHTSPPNTTATLLTSTPPPTHLFPSSSHTPAVLPSITPSTPPPRTRASTAPPKILEVTSDQGKGVEETAGGELTNRFINTNSLIAVLIFGLLFFIVTIVLFLRHAYESYKRRGYTQMDYLINGMYSDSGL
ncbi:60S ribosomal protein L27a [Bagarius yarrelli]|uniref:Large ribosomal subunit protein uL15 n=1 Tax=Bagarius yarrelli TaxID=175774 RepID=A0A556VBW5_BAGYA|nr:60S ribosomal protein L27a [Bagarius yarrelli]